MQVYWNGRKIDDVRTFCRENGFDLVQVQEFRQRYRWELDADAFTFWGRILDLQEEFPEFAPFLEEIEEKLKEHGFFRAVPDGLEPVGSVYEVPAPLWDNRIACSSLFIRREIGRLKPEEITDADS